MHDTSFLIGKYAWYGLLGSIQTFINHTTFARLAEVDGKYFRDTGGVERQTVRLGRDQLDPGFRQALFELATVLFSYVRASIAVALIFLVDDLNDPPGDNFSVPRLWIILSGRRLLVEIQSLFSGSFKGVVVQLILVRIRTERFLIDDYFAADVRRSRFRGQFETVKLGQPKILLLSDSAQNILIVQGALQYWPINNINVIN